MGAFVGHPRFARACACHAYDAEGEDVATVQVL
jgi:hypothetical protein